MFERDGENVTDFVPIDERPSARKRGSSTGGNRRTGSAGHEDDGVATSVDILSESGNVYHAESRYARPAHAGSGASNDLAVPAAPPRTAVIIAISIIAMLVIVLLVARGCAASGSDAGTGSNTDFSGSAAVQAGNDVEDAAGANAADASEQSASSVTVDLLMVGDILVHRGVWESGEQADGTRDYTHLFAHTADQIAAADLAIVDQETVLGGEGVAPISGYPTFNSPQEIGDAEVAAGFDCILRASNHSMDMWEPGLTSELTFWRERHPQMLVVGAVMPGETTAAEAGPVYYEKDGLTIAILNYTQDLNGLPDAGDAVCELDAAQLRRDIAIAEENADITVVCPHWGDEGAQKPNGEQRAWAQLMCDLGVDAVFGNHPHVMQPVDVFTSKDGAHAMPVFWSVGNFVSTMLEPENMVAGIATATVVKDEQGARVTSVGLTPIVTHRGYGSAMTTYLLRDYTDALADSNAWVGDEVRPTPAWCEQLCETVLGDTYDPQTQELTIRLEQDVTDEE